MKLTKTQKNQIVTFLKADEAHAKLLLECLFVCVPDTQRMAIYKKLRFILHPDRGGSTSLFQALADLNDTRKELSIRPKLSLPYLELIFNYLSSIEDLDLKSYRENVLSKVDITDEENMESFLALGLRPPKLHDGSLVTLAIKIKEAHQKKLEETRYSDFSIADEPVEELEKYQQQYADFNQAIADSLQQFSLAMVETKKEIQKKSEEDKKNKLVLASEIKEIENKIGTSEKEILKIRDKVLSMPARVEKVVDLVELDVLAEKYQHTRSFALREKMAEIQAAELGLGESRRRYKKVQAELKQLLFIRQKIFEYIANEKEIRLCGGHPGFDAIGLSQAKDKKRRLKKEIIREIDKINKPHGRKIKDFIRKKMELHRKLYPSMKGVGSYYLSSNSEISLKYALFKIPHISVESLGTYVAKLEEKASRIYNLEGILERTNAEFKREKQAYMHKAQALDVLIEKKRAIEEKIEESQSTKPGRYSFWRTMDKDAFVKPLTYAQIEEKLQTTFQLYIRAINNPLTENLGKLHEDIHQWRRDVHRIEGKKILQSVGGFLAFVILSVITLRRPSFQKWIDSFYYFSRDAAWGKIGHGLDEMEAICFHKYEGVDKNPLVLKSELSVDETILFYESKTASVGDETKGLEN